MPRIIFSLRIDTRPGGLEYLIAPLDPAGNSPHVHHCDQKKRVIDLRIGDQLGKRYTVHDVKAFRQTMNWRWPAPVDGYTVREG